MVTWGSLPGDKASIPPYAFTEWYETVLQNKVTENYLRNMYCCTPSLRTGWSTDVSKLFSGDTRSGTRSEHRVSRQFLVVIRPEPLSSITLSIHCSLILTLNSIEFKKLTVTWNKPWYIRCGVIHRMWLRVTFGVHNGTSRLFRNAVHPGRRQPWYTALRTSNSMLHLLYLLFWIM